MFDNKLKDLIILKKLNWSFHLICNMNKIEFITICQLNKN
jgi:hypothetical protein